MLTHQSSSGPKLVPIGVLLAIAGVIAALLFSFFGVRKSHEGISNRSRADAVSIAHLRLMLRSSPGDSAIRLDLVDQLIEVAQLDEAEATLAPLLAVGPLRAAAVERSLAIDRSRWLAATGSKREQRRRALLARLAIEYTRILVPPVPWSDLAADLGSPQLAAELLLAAQAAPPNQREARWLRAAEWLGAAGNLGGAADLYAKLAESTSGRNPQLLRRRTVLAVKAAIAAQRANKARALIERALRLLPDDPTLLGLAIDRALAEGQATEAVKIARRWWERQPRSDALARRLARVYLAVGSIADARELYLYLGNRRTHEDQEQLARLEEWTGHPSEALAAWHSLLRSRGLAKDEREVDRLARATHNDEVLLEIYERRLRRGEALDARALADMVRRAELLGDPERALALLDGFLRAHPDRRDAWLFRADLLVRAGRPKEGLLAYSDYAARFPADREVDLRRARLAFRIGDLDAALAILQGRAARANDREYHELLAAVALTLEDGETLVRALLALAALDALDAYGYVRLVEAEAAQGDLEDAQRHVLEGFGRHPSAELITVGIEAMLRGQRIDLAETLIPLALAHPDGVTDQTYFWALKAQIDHGRGRALAYEADLLQIVTLDPSADDALAGIIWSILDRDNRAALERALQRWKSLGPSRPALWRPLAAAAERLHRSAEAARWYALLYAQGQVDAPLLLGYARTLEASGHSLAPWRLRRHALAQLVADRTPDSALMRAVTAQQVGAHFAAQRAQAELEAQPDPDAETRAFLGWVHLSAGREIEARRDLSGLRTLSAARLSLALHDRDLELVSRIIDAEGDRLPATARAEALLALGREEAALTTAIVGLDGAREDEVKALIATAQEVIRLRPNQAHAYSRSARIADLELRSVGLDVEISRHDLGARLSARFTEMNARPGESAFSIAARKHWTRGVTELKLGAVPGGEQAALIQGSILGRRTILRGLTVAGVLAAGEQVDDTAALRIGAARERIGLAVSYDPWPRVFTSVSLDNARYRQRGGSILGQGLLAEVSAGYLIRAAGPNWQVRAAASGAMFDVAPEGLGLIAPRFATTGVGIRLASGEVGEVPSFAGGWRYRVDVFGGWLLPSKVLAHQFEAAVGRSIWGGDELGVRGTFGNAIGLDGSVRASAEAYYSVRLWP